MVAAINAKNENNNVILIEKNDRVGKKLLATVMKWNLNVRFTVLS